MIWSDYLRAASEALLRGGELVTNQDVVDLAMKMPGGASAFLEDAEHAAATAARRAASRLLSRTGVASDDPTAGKLFSTIPYDPPRSLTLPQADGTVGHKAVEHCTRGENLVHQQVLRANIAAVTAEAERFDAFAADMARSQPDDETTNGDVMRARADAATEVAA